MDAQTARAARPLPSRALVTAALAALAGPIAFAPGLRPAPAFAQSGQHLVNDDAAGEENRIDPVAVRLDSGDLLALWLDNTWGQLDVLARRFHPDLSPLDEPRMINDDGGVSDQTALAISPAAGGRFAAAWLDGRRSPVAVYAQIFDAADGSTIGSNIELTVDRANGLRDRPAVATDARGYSLVCWEEATFGLRRIRAQLLGDTGQRIGDPFFAAPETAERPQRSPAVGVLPDGRWLLVWEETVGTEFRVYHRVLEADGTALEPPRQDHGESIIDPRSSPNPTVLTRSGDALVLWTDNRSGTSDVWGLWLDAQGRPQGSPALVRAGTDSALDFAVRAALAPDGSYAVTWTSSGASDDSPLVRFFAADRTPLSGDLPLPDPQVGGLARPGVAVALSATEWALVWTDDRSLSQQVYLRRVARDGSATGGVSPGWSVPASASQFLPDVALLPDGRAVVVWLDLRSGTVNLYGRILDAEGRPQGQSFPINTLPVTRTFPGPTKVESYWDNRPRVAASGIGTFLVTWSSTPGAGTRALLARLYDADGQPIGDSFLVTDPAGELDPQTDPCPAMAADGRFGIAWRNVVVQNQDSNNEIFYQLFDPLGARAGPKRNPVDADARAADQLLPSLAISPYGEVVTAWMDRRGREWEVYRQRTAWDGTPLETFNTRVSEGGPVYGTAAATNGSSILVLWEDRYATAGLIRGRLQILETKDGAAGALPSRSGVVDIVVNDFDSPTGTKFPRVAMDASGRFIVVWWDERGGRRRVWCRRYDAEGNPLGPPYELPAGDTPSNRQYPSVAADLERIQFVWADTRRARGWDALARRVDWAYDGQPVPIQLHAFEARSERDGLRVRWEVPLSASGSWFRLWRDEADAGRGPRPSPRAVPVTPDWLRSEAGTFEVLDARPPARVPLFYYLESLEAGASEYLGPLGAQWDPPAARGWSAGPVPFRHRVELRPPDAAPVRLEIWDVSGRRVRSLERAQASDAPLVWDGRDRHGRVVPSGIYFVRLPAGIDELGSEPGGAGAEVARLVRTR